MATWLPLALLALAFAYVGLWPLLSFVWDVAQDPSGALAVINTDVAKAAGRTLLLVVVLTPLQLVGGFWLGAMVSRTRHALFVGSMLALPLFMGSTYCALLWKLLLDPSNGLPSIVARMMSTTPWDWTESPLAALVLVGTIQLWIWSMVVGSSFTALTSPDTLVARDLFALDGAKPQRAYALGLWSTRRSWVSLILLATVVENLRTFEPTLVLTRGGPGSATETLQWLIFEESYIKPDEFGLAAASLSLLLVMLCVGLLALSNLIVRRMRADE